MTNLQKLIANYGWVELCDAHAAVTDGLIPNRILAKRESVIHPYEPRIIYKSSTIITSSGKPVSFPCWSDYETQTTLRVSQFPTHYMPLDTPERMAKVIEVLVDALDIMVDNVNNAEMASIQAKLALQTAEQIAGGEDVR